MTLYDFVMAHGGIDINDTIYDYLNYFDFTDNDHSDNYDKVMIWMAKHIEVVKLGIWGDGRQLECKIAEFIEKHRKIFDEFCNQVYVEEYQPQHMETIEYESDEFYDYYLGTFSDLINGHFSDKRYKAFLDIIGRFENE